MNSKINKDTVALKEALSILIKDSESGKRVQRNGSKVTKGTIVIYKSVKNRFAQFEEFTGKTYELLLEKKSNERIRISQTNYWKKFYNSYRKYLFSNEVNGHDNYVTMHMKTLKLAISYLRREKHKQIGNYEYLFYNARVEPVIICFPMDKLSKLINTWKEIELPERKKEILALFLFGISVGLRYCDLKALRKNQIESFNDSLYLHTQSKKTGTETKTRLPEYATDILNIYQATKGRGLFNLPSLHRFNKNLKEIAVILEWNWPVMQHKYKYGKSILQNEKIFSDVISSHMMRRTAITTLLTLGVPETTVRQISGHARGSKEFFRYVHFAQFHLDNHTDEAWTKLVKG